MEIIDIEYIDLNKQWFYDFLLAACNECLGQSPLTIDSVEYLGYEQKR